MIDSEQIKKDLRQDKKVTQNFPCKNAPQILAHVIISPVTSDTCSLAGYPIDIKTGNKIAGYSRKSLSNKPIAHVELEILALCGMVEADYQKKSPAPVTGTKPRITVDSEHFFSAAFRRCPELQDYSIPISDWGPSTRKKNVIYFLRSIVPQMDRCGKDITTEDMEKISDMLSDRAYHNGRTKFCADGSRNPKDMSISKNTVRERMRDAQRIYDWIRITYPELGLPDISFCVIPKSKVSRAEQRRYIPIEFYVKSSAIINRLIFQEGILLANGAQLMFRDGTRTAEAAAPLLGEFLLFDDSPYGTYHIGHQIKDGKRVPYTKTTAGERPIPITSDTRHLVEFHRSYLLSLGYSEAEVSEMPFVPHPKDPTKHIDPSLLSALCLDILHAAGATPEYLAHMEELMHKEPDKDAYGNDIFDLSAYIARRNFVSYASNVTTISNSELCVIVGHEENRKLRERLRTHDRMVEIAQKLEHIVLDPEYSTSPTVSSLILRDAANIHLNGCTQYTFVAEEDMVLHIDTICKEPGETIKCSLTGHAENLRRRAPLDTPEKRIGREIMGKWPDADKLRDWIAEVQAMDLSRFAKYRSKVTKRIDLEAKGHD